jgi:hypothetical protein
MHRIAVIGNCQAAGVASAMQFLVKNSYVKQILTWETSKWYEDDEKLFADLATFDHIFMQRSWGGRINPDTFKALQDRKYSVTEFPIITFPAFHPDLIYATIEGRSGFLNGPIGPYNSAIALFGYLAGIDVESVLKLYTREVYSKLGYLDMWSKSLESLIADAAKYDINIASEVNEWLREGSFMYSINHAKILPLAQLARILLKKTNVRSMRNLDLQYIEDHGQKDAIWPIYPEIAERFSITGSYVFKKPDYAVTNHLDTFFDLSDFVQNSYMSMSYFRRANLKNERVIGWLNDEELRTWLLERALH